MRCVKITFLTLFTLILFSASAVALDDQATVEIKDNNDVVALLHGLGRSKTAMWLLASRLEDAGYTVFRIDYDSLTVSPDTILIEISNQIDACCKQLNQTVHFVGHSLGGLLIRAYLDENRINKLGRVVLMGTPNQGTPLVDQFRDTWWFKLSGPTTLALGTDNNSFPKSLQPPYYPVGIIAGEINTHLSEKLLAGKNDGLVPVESTKLSGMTDFIVINTGHSTMRYDEDVARQTVYFLQNGHFDTANITNSKADKSSE